MGKKNNEEKAAATREPFDIDAPELPEWIDEHALTSGGYPYDKRMKRKKYERHLHKLQIELMKLQRHVIDTGERVAIVFEGRDSAGKGGTIHRVTQHLNPRQARVVALPKPTEVEAGQWYMQRYVTQMPTRGEIVIFDRSWYNRAGVEPVMGFCTPEETRQFLDTVPRFERMMTDDGIRLIKFWLDIGHEMQLKRLHARRHDPLKQWKLSPIDIKGMALWDEYTRARDTMLRRSDNIHAPWTIVRSNDKKRLRLNVIRSLLGEIVYNDRDMEAIGQPDPKLVHTVDQFFAGG
ncbi:MAG: polyphosphate kinase 2 [Tepidamorphaceae bacterium]|nr:polyphosphate kinase 2 [Rhodobiaceae bacterium]MCC0050142.1 polyphosphate kinase 2 [Rhodobiaceae bacterium]